MQEVTFYVMLNTGKLMVLTQFHKHLLDLLVKFRIKGAKFDNTMMAMYTTNLPAGSYSISYQSNGQQLTAVAVIPGPPPPMISVDIKIPKEHKKAKGFSRDQKREWRDQWKQHSRNTGRR